MILFPFLKKKKASRGKCSVGQIVSADVHCPREKAAPLCSLAFANLETLIFFTWNGPCGMSEM